MGRATVGTERVQHRVHAHLLAHGEERRQQIDPDGPTQALDHVEEGITIGHLARPLRPSPRNA
jgi:hypothetical protein